MSTPILPEQPPYSEDAEEAVLGAVLIDPVMVDVVREIISPQDFHDERRGTIFDAMLKIEKLDYMTLTDALRTPDWNDYVVSLINAVPTSIHAEYYAKIVKWYSTRRKALEVAGVIAAASHREQSVEKIIAIANKAVSGLSEHLPGGPVPAKAILSDLYDSVERWVKHPLKSGEVRGLSTGFKDLNAVTGGLDRSELYVICGRPGVGKTALSLDVARTVALNGYKVLIFSLEMTAESVMARWASAMSGVSVRIIQRGIGDAQAYIDAILRLSLLKNLWIDDQPSLSPDQVRARALKIAREAGGLDLFVLDHGAKMSSDERGKNEATIEGRKTEAMKDLAKELRCPGILVLQLNRNVENRADKRPRLPDLRQSGRHEEEATQVWGLFREDYYDPEALSKDMLEVEVLKNRHGPCGTAMLHYNRETQKLSDVEAHSIGEKVF